MLLFFLFLFLSPPRLFVRLFWPCVLFVLGFLRGAILGPRGFFGFSRDSSEAFFLGREAVEAFALFLVCCFSRFAAPHVSRRPPRHSMPQGARKQVVSPAPWGSAPQVQCASRAEGLRPPPVWFFFGVSSVCFGPQELKSLIVCRGDCCVAPRLSHARFFPRSFSLSLSLAALSLSFSLSGCWPLGPRPGSHDAVGRGRQNHRCPYVGGNAARFFAVAFSGNSREIARDRRSRRKI